MRGINNKNHDILYDGIKINNLGNSFINVNQFPLDGLIGMEIINLGSFQTMPTFGAFNLIPIIKYRLDAKLKQYTSNINYDNYLGLGSVGFKYASMNCIYSQKSKSLPYQDNDSLKILLSENHNSLNLGLRNNKNLELRFMGFQNKTYFVIINLMIVAGWLLIIWLLKLYTNKKIMVKWLYIAYIKKTHQMKGLIESSLDK